jgi:hypothetical protein
MTSAVRVRATIARFTASLNTPVMAVHEGERIALRGGRYAGTPQAGILNSRLPEASR